MRVLCYTWCPGSLDADIGASDPMLCPNWGNPRLLFPPDFFCVFFEGMPPDSVLTMFGLYILPPKIFELLEERIAGNVRDKGEFQFTPALEKLRGDTKMLGFVLEVQQLRHHFWTISRAVLSTTPPRTRRVLRSIWVPMLSEC